MAYDDLGSQPADRSGLLVTLQVSLQSLCSLSAVYFTILVTLYVLSVFSSDTVLPLICILVLSAAGPRYLTAEASEFSNTIEHIP